MTFLQDYGFFTFFVINLLGRFANQSNSLNKSSLLETGTLLWLFIVHHYLQTTASGLCGDNLAFYRYSIVYSKGKIPKITTLQSYNLEV